VHAVKNAQHVWQCDLTVSDRCCWCRCYCVLAMKILLLRGCTFAGYKILEFVKGPEIGRFGGLGGPGGPENPSKRCGAKPHTFWKGFPGRRGRPDL